MPRGIWCVQSLLCHGGRVRGLCSLWSPPAPVCCPMDSLGEFQGFVPSVQTGTNSDFVFTEYLLHPVLCQRSLPRELNCSLCNGKVLGQEGSLGLFVMAHFSLELLLGENEHVILSPLPCENQLLIWLYSICLTTTKHYVPVTMGSPLWFRVFYSLVEFSENILRLCKGVQGSF